MTKRQEIPALFDMVLSNLGEPVEVRKLPDLKVTGVLESVQFAIEQLGWDFPTRITVIVSGIEIVLDPDTDSFEFLLETEDEE